jgi:hypothetical protein
MLPRAQVPRDERMSGLMEEAQTRREWVQATQAEAPRPSVPNPLGTVQLWMLNQVPPGPL